MALPPSNSCASRGLNLSKTDTAMTSENPQTEEPRRSFLPVLGLVAGVLLLGGAGVGIAMKQVTTAAATSADGAPSANILQGVFETLSKNMMPMTRQERDLAALPDIDGWTRIDAAGKAQVDALRDRLTKAMSGGGGVNAAQLRKTLAAAAGKGDPDIRKEMGLADDEAPMMVAVLNQAGKAAQRNWNGAVYVRGTEAMLIAINHSPSGRTALGRQLRGIGHSGMERKKIHGRTFRVQRLKGRAVRITTPVTDTLEVTFVGLAADASLKTFIKSVDFNGLKAG